MPLSFLADRFKTQYSLDTLQPALNQAGLLYRFCPEVYWQAYSRQERLMVVLAAGILALFILRLGNYHASSPAATPLHFASR
ncbi:hypothetical protein EGJ15_26025 [Pseudomonas sp. p99-361]|nr:hypothetical protein EGJ15_26025 [Pseudomonas sp. p99-361]